MVPRGVPVGGLVVVEYLLYPRKRALGNLARGGSRSRVEGAVGEGAERPALAVLLAARARLVEVRVVELLLGAVREGACHAVLAAVLVEKLRRACREALGPLRARPRRVSEEGSAPPVAVGVRVHAVLPVVGPANRAPLRLEGVSDEVLGGLQLLLLGEVRHQELLARVRKGAEAASWAAPRLVTKTLAEELWVVEQLGRAVAEAAGLSTPATVLVIEGLVARLGHIGQRVTAAWHVRHASPVPLTVEERTAAVVVRVGGLAVAGLGLELPDHPADLRIDLRLSCRCPRACTAPRRRIADHAGRLLG
mmetsp:Transcript_104589/g.278290  ORF Transcript_104589/g.278290 Transcript_104589/m.278290 type:complete len:307 (-) Transcript_104589:146-1066(-)